MAARAYRIKPVTVRSSFRETGPLISEFVAGVCRYAVKYNEQLLLTLEEDEFSCKQRLAYKLEQVSSSE